MRDSQVRDVSLVENDFELIISFFKRILSLKKGKLSKIIPNGKYVHFPLNKWSCEFSHLSFYIHMNVIIIIIIINYHNSSSF